MNDFLASIENGELVQIAFDLLGAQGHALVLVDDDLRITAASEGAKSQLGVQVLCPIAELLSEGIVDALRTCVRERSGAELSDTIDEIAYRIYVRAHTHGLMLHLKLVTDIYHTALTEYQTRHIREDITSIAIAAQTMAKSEQGNTDTLPNKVYRHALSIQRLLTHAEQLTTTLTPDLGECDLAKLCRDLVERVRKRCGSKIHVSADELPRACPLIADEKLLTQALCNLLVNAVQAPEVTEITLQLTRENGEVIVSVSDNGTGIPDNRLLRLYDGWRTLQTADSLLTEAAERLAWGLGLPVTNSIAGAHDGVLLWKANQPRGCTFTLCLPERRIAPYVLAQPMLRIQSGFDVAEVELSVLNEE